MLVQFLIGICLALTFVKSDIHVGYEEPDEEPYYPNLNFSDNFDWQLLKELSSQHKNVLISPISLKIILALLYQGSSAITQREFQNVLQFVDKESVNDDYKQILESLQTTDRSEYLLNMGTSIFLDSEIPVNPNFEITANRYYRTQIKSTSFSNPKNASRSINSWVDKITNGKVSHLVQPEDLQQTVMLIANAVYFKGTWRHQFPKNQKYLENFYVSGENIDNLLYVKIPYMSTTDQFYIKESKDLDSKILRLPYKGSAYSMFIILPNSRGGLPNLITKINLYSLSRLRHSLRKRLVDVNIPKFKFSFQVKMADTLRAFGLHDMFENTASFTGITKGNNSLLRTLVVSDIIQKSGIEVDEEGSVVYSATDVNIGNKFGELRDTFNATHPFIFFIEGPNGSILFIGKVENPSDQEPIRLENPLAVTPISQQNIAEGQFLSEFPSSNQNLLQSNRVNNPNFSQGQSFVNLQPSGTQGLVPNLEPNNEEDIFIDKDELIYRFNLFDVELLNSFGNSDTNVFISPASIKITLAMILEGARGSCAQEISEALRIPNLEQKGVRDILMELIRTLMEKSPSTYLENSNAVFASDRYAVVAKYKNTIEQFYGGKIIKVNFKNIGNTVTTINNWVSEATHGAIREIIGPRTVTAETSAVIANALYFKGKWKTAFDKDSTKSKCFHTLRGCVFPPMMHVADNFNYNYISRLRAHAVEIPYQEKFSMLIILPSEDTNIRSVIRDLPHFKLADIISKLKPADITLEIPRFEFDYSADLVQYLKPLRITEIFGSNANLTGIIENGNVLINNLVHKTKIVVDEEGTIAAAATEAIVIPLMGSTTVVADRPFIFCIYHKETANIIFEGILLNPLEQGSSPVLNNEPSVGRKRQNVGNRHIFV